MTTSLPRHVNSFEPLSPDDLPTFSFDDYQAIENQKRNWQIMPPVVTSGQLAAIQKNNAHLASPTDPRNQEAYNIHTPAPLVSPAEAPPLCRVSFVGPDQQWYSIKIGQGSSGSAPHTQAPPVQASMMQNAQAYPMQPPMMQTVQDYPMQPPLAQALHPTWLEQDFAPEESDKEKASKDFVLQIIQPGLTGLMDGSVSTLAPIFSVAFATHQPFTAFLVGLSSALGAGISMTFSEALSDDGELTGRGKPFLRGGVTGLMTFLSGVGHALPFLIPSLHLALLTAYAVVAVELVLIAAIRHKFFGTSWWLSMVQVVGGGALVFAVALLLGNA